MRNTVANIHLVKVTFYSEILSGLFEIRGKEATESLDQLGSWETPHKQLFVFNYKVKNFTYLMRGFISTPR